MGPILHQKGLYDTFLQSLERLQNLYCERDLTFLVKHAPHLVVFLLGDDMTLLKSESVNVLENNEVYSKKY